MIAPRPTGPLNEFRLAAKLPRRPEMSSRLLFLTLIVVLAGGFTAAQEREAPLAD